MAQDPKAARRRFNFSLLRHLRGTHKMLVADLRGTASWNEISKYAMGDRDISDFRARAIERQLDLPQGWLDREHAADLKASAETHRLFTLAQGADPNLREAVRAILEHSNVRSLGQQQAEGVLLTLVK